MRTGAVLVRFLFLRETRGSYIKNIVCCIDILPHGSNMTWAEYYDRINDWAVYKGTVSVRR